MNYWVMKVNASTVKHSMIPCVEYNLGRITEAIKNGN